MIITYYHDYVTKEQKVTGGMAEIDLDASTVSRFLREGVVIAYEDSPRSTTKSGDLPQLKKVIETVKKERPGVIVRRKKIDMPLHSRQYSHLGREFLTLTRNLSDHMKALTEKYSNLVQTEIEA